MVQAPKKHWPDFTKTYAESERKTSRADLTSSNKFSLAGIQHSDSLLTLLFELQRAGSEFESSAYNNHQPLLVATHFQDAMVYLQGRAEEMSANSVFVLSELICPQICLIHALHLPANH